ncbi:hypothetical protein BGZ60DRAFT_20381 [Tricladium varicosporioides]|nr:hypothetical protein BGZ60DRAFT_20381 [Hymenoscyphus varicosporioides]
MAYSSMALIALMVIFWPNPFPHQPTNALASTAARWGIVCELLLKSLESFEGVSLETSHQDNSLYHCIKIS